MSSTHPTVSIQSRPNNTLLPEKTSALTSVVVSATTTYRSTSPSGLYVEPFAIVTMMLKVDISFKCSNFTTP